VRSSPFRAAHQRTRTRERLVADRLTADQCLWLPDAGSHLREDILETPYRTPLTGLFLGSAAGFPGGAVHGVPGDAAAGAALRHITRAPI
jgi:phytoene dehydrogenase-like protein